MQRDRRLPRAQILVALVAALLGSPALPAAAEQPVSTERVLRVGVVHDAETLNPAFPGNDVDREITRLQFAGLTTRSIPDLEVEPDLAESWAVSDDGRTVTYTLRAGLRWSDGQPLTADDVVATLGRARDEHWPAYADVVEHLRAEKRDARHVVVTSDVPDPRLPALEVPILPRHVYGKIGAGELRGHEATDGVGSGPYVLAENDPGARRTLRRNPNWWAGAPFVEQVDLLVYRQADDLVGALAANDLDAAVGLPAAEYDRIAGSHDVTGISGRSSPVVVLTLDTQHGDPALRDARVRRAIDLAVDRALVAEAVSGGLSTPLDRLPVSLVPPAWPPNEQAGVSPEPQTHAAARALAEAGYGNDGGTPLRLRVAPLPSWPESATTALADSLERAGVEVELVAPGADADLAAHELDLSPEPFTILRLFACTGKPAGDPVTWCDSDFDNTYRSYLSSSADRHDALVEELSATIDRELPVVTLYQRNELQGYRIDRFTEWSRQPRRYGPVLFSGTSLPYTRLEPSPIFSVPGSKRKLMLAVGGGAGLLVLAAAAGFVVLRRTGRLSRKTGS